MSATGIFTQRTIYWDQYADRIAGAIIAVLTFAAMIFPRALPFFYFTLVIMALVELSRTGRLAKLLSAPSHFWTFATIFIIWCLLTVFWSATPAAAAGKIVFLAAIFLGAWTIMNWLTTISATMSLQIKLGLLTGFLLGAAILATEVTFQQPIKKLMLETFDFLAPKSGKHIRYANGEVLYISEYQLNRGIAVLNIFFWPAVLLALKLFKAHLRLAVLVIMTAIVMTATYYSVHQSSMIAFALGALVFGLMGISPRISRIFVATGWICAVLFVLPAIHGAYNAKLYNAEWMPKTAQTRIIFWTHTAHEYSSNPIVGVGVRSTKHIDDTTRSEAVQLPGHPTKMRTGRHGHNIYLQTWYELGAVGAMLFLFTGLAFLSRVNKLPVNAKPYAFAAFSVGATLAAFTWGMWQVWYISMFAMAAALMLLASHQINPTGPDDVV